MKAQIPDALKADLPANIWGKILSATPVVMAVMATILAGLASSEMTQAQYDRSLGAQLQSKAGDQWGLFQAKRMRGSLQRSTLDLLSSSFELHPLDASAPMRAPLQGPAREQLQALFGSPKGQAALDLLGKGELPEVGAGPSPDPAIAAAIGAVESSSPDSAIAPMLSQVQNADLDHALRSANDQLQAFDRAMQPMEQAIGLVGSLLARQRTGLDISLNRDFTALRLHLEAQRYDAEARLNRAVANLYELQVRKYNLSAERHHVRSQRFFYGMLGAQMAVIIATLAMAARQRNLLWSLAAAAGLCAVSFALYVYINV